MTLAAGALLAYARTVALDVTIPVTAGAILELARVAHEPDRLGTPDDIAARYGVAASTARGWLASGRIPGAFRVPRLGWRFDLSEIKTLDTSLKGDAATAGLSSWRTPNPGGPRG